MKIFRKPHLALLILICALTLSSFGEDMENEDRDTLLDDYHDKIEKLDFDYGKGNSVVEALALLELQKEYPEPDYEIIPNIVYRGLDDSKLGEFDLVVWDKKKDRAHIVYMVKSSRAFARAKQIADSQIANFKEKLAARDIWDFESEQLAAKVFNKEQFKDVEKFGLIGIKGATDRDFDMEVDITSDEVRILQKMMIDPFYERPKKEETEEE